MGRSMLPILMLTSVALSSSNVLPILPNNANVESFNIDDQSNDNIFLNSYQTNAPNNIFYKNRAAQYSYVSIPNLKEITESMNTDYDNSGDEKDFSDKNNKVENYDDDGYRKEQWHNYPRQLDHLHRQDTRDESNEAAIAERSEIEPIDRQFDDFTRNEFRLRSAYDDHNVYENVVAATDPFLVLRVQLTYLRDDVKRNDFNQYPNSFLSQSENDPRRNMEDNNLFLEDIESTAHLVKVKREDPTKIGDNEITHEGSFISEIENSSGSKKAVKKRLFSLWSRLQSLSHRGHELHHRRHMHAFYSSPDNIKGNGIVTAQTRATFVRPPGSPLRWG